MKVSNSKLQATENPKIDPKETSQAAIRAKIKAKFGDKALEKKKEVAQGPKEKVELNSKGGVKNSDEEGFGDVGLNNPDSQLTHDKLKQVLKTGAFKFNDKERATLAKILK